MKKKSDEDEKYRQLILASQGQGISTMPSDNLSILPIADEDFVSWQWIDAVHVMDKERDPYPFIALLRMPTCWSA